MNKIVLGLGFGDEGKGMVIDYLSLQQPDSLVVRFSGGHQSGHTVVRNNARHVFSNFGSGTFNNCPTYWSKFCTVEPIGLVKEYNILLEKGLKPIIYIDGRCPLTTQYEIELNQSEEKWNINGTCGVGFGATKQREENLYSLTFQDIYFPYILYEKLDILSKYYSRNLYLKEFLYSCDFIKNSNSFFIDNGHILECYKNNIIFEGSQGLMLSQNIGFYPHVTWDYTDFTNLKSLININECDTYFVTRAYQTRHGNGPMTNKGYPFDIINNENETNKTNEYQGNFRTNILDVSMLEYALKKCTFECDYKFIEDNMNLVVTCIDQISEYNYTYNNKLYNFNNYKSFAKSLGDILEIEKVYINKTESGHLEKII